MYGHDDVKLADPAASTREHIESVIDEGRSVTVDSCSGNTGDRKQTEDGIIANHADVAPGLRERNGVTGVQKHDPWGSTRQGNGGVDDGAFRMSGEDVDSSFRQIQLMNTPPSGAG